jgi:hypothetical protein
MTENAIGLLLPLCPKEMIDLAVPIAFHNLAHQYIRQTGQQICSQLTTYLALPQQLNQMNAETIAAGLLDINDQVAGEQYLWRQARLFKSISYIGYALLKRKRETGAGRWIDGINLAVYENRNARGFDYATNEQGDRTQLIQSYDFDPVSSTRLQRVRQAGQPLWTEIYISDDIHNVEVAEAFSLDASRSALHNLGYHNYVAVNAESPLYDATGNLIGVMIVDVLLSDISQFLNQLNVGGQIFIMERDGQLVGCSGGLPIVQPDRSERYNALSHPDLKTIAQAIPDFQNIRTTQQFSFIHNEQRQFVSITPWQDEYGLDWLVVVGISEPELLAAGAALCLKR